MLWSIKIKNQANSCFSDNNHYGFTIIELMITVALAAVLLAIGIPSLTTLVRNNTLATQTNTILSSIHYARSQTITKNTNITIQPIVSGTDWTQGWIVTDGTADGVRQFEAIDNASLIVDTGENEIVYLPDGSITNASAITLVMTPTECPTGNPDIREIDISLSGQVSVATTACP